MRLAKTDIVAGLEAPVVRDLMRRLRTPGATDYLRSRLPGGVDAAAVAGCPVLDVQQVLIGGGFGDAYDKAQPGTRPPTVARR